MFSTRLSKVMRLTGLDKKSFVPASDSSLDVAEFVQGRDHQDHDLF